MNKDKKSDQEIKRGFKGAIKSGWIEKVGKDEFRLTEEGKKFVDTNFPRTQKRAQIGEMSIQEYMASCEEESAERRIKKERG